MELENLADFDNFIFELEEESNVEELFSENGLLIEYMNRAGKKLVSTAFINFDREGADRAHNRALEMGANTEQAGKIRENFNSGTVDMLTYGKELLWLAQVLPSYVNGDPTLFNSTATEMRGQFRQVKEIVKMLGTGSIQNFMDMYQDYVIYEASLLNYYALFY